MNVLPQQGLGFMTLGTLLALQFYDSMIPYLSIINPENQSTYAMLVLLRGKKKEMEAEKVQFT